MIRGALQYYSDTAIQVTVLIFNIQPRSKKTNLNRNGEEDARN